MQYLSLLALFFCVQISTCRPSDDVKNEESEHHHSSSIHQVSSWGDYQVSVSENDVDGKCQVKLVLRGPGMSKTEHYPCPEHPESVIVMGGTLFITDRYYSDTPGELVHLEHDKCEKEVFTEKDGKYSSKMKPMDDTDCEKVKAKIELLQKEQKEWAEWVVGYQQNAQEQLLQAEQTLQNLHQQLGDFFGWEF